MLTISEPNMLKHRIITAVILISLVFAGLYFLSPTAFCILTGLLTLAAASEWTNFMGLKKISSRFSYLAIIGGLAIICAKFVLIPVVLFIGFIWCWLIAGLILFLRVDLCGESIFGVIMEIFVLLPTWVAINYIFMEENGRLALLFTS